MTNTPWGFGSSPVLHDAKVIVQCDVVSEQFLAAFDAKDGHELWRARREEVARQMAAERDEDEGGIGIYTGYGE